MSVNLILETNDVRDLCNFLEYALEQYKKEPNHVGWDDRIYNEMRINQLLNKIKNNKEYIEHRRRTTIFRASADAGINLD